MSTKPTTTTASAAPEKTAHDYMITRAPGGTAERREKLGTLKILDLWHIALSQPDKESENAILDVWHLAHDLKRELGTAFELIVALQGALNKRSEQFAQAIDALKKAEAVVENVGGFHRLASQIREVIARAEGRGQ